MTDAEKLVWAAVFAKEFNWHNRPSRLCQPGSDDAWEQWENEKAMAAMESAAMAVCKIRDNQKSIKEGWGKDDEVTIFAAQMVKR